MNLMNQFLLHFETLTFWKKPWISWDVFYGTPKTAILLLTKNPKIIFNLFSCYFNNFFFFLQFHNWKWGEGGHHKFLLLYWWTDKVSHPYKYPRWEDQYRGQTHKDYRPYDKIAHHGTQLGSEFTYMKEARETAGIVLKIAGIDSLMDYPIFM